ncbi:UNVERIFIED_CONTAM: hypothetical protein FKN15_052702 [Acipenser sinensis]
MVAFAEKVFASVVGDEETREEISIFDVSEDCPIIHHARSDQLLLETKESTEKRKKRAYQAQTMAVAMSEKQSLISVQESEVGVPTYQDVPAFQRVAILGDYASGMTVEDFELVCNGLYRALTIREKYMRLSYQRFPSTASKYLRAIEGETWKSEDQVQPVFTSPPKPGENPLSLDGLPENLGYHARMKDGVIYVYPSKEAAGKNQPKDLSYPDYETFIDDMNFLIALIAQGPTKTYTHHRLKFLQSKFNVHEMLNETEEMKEVKNNPHRDFYNCRKVDTHIHAAACMNQKHLLRFIKKSYRVDADRVVHDAKGSKMTLKELFASLKLHPYDLTVDSLDVHAGRQTFQRFDKFNAKYNPVGASELRDLYMKTENYIDGEYFATIIKMSECHISLFVCLERGMNTFQFRPHCGEAGAVTHLLAAFMTADNISHGLNLKKSPVLQYLYFLAQIPIAMSPLSNNSLFLEYAKSPLREFHQKGLIISLSTDDPMQFHYTKVRHGGALAYWSTGIGVPSTPGLHSNPVLNCLMNQSDLHPDPAVVNDVMLPVKPGVEWPTRTRTG